VTPPRTPWRIGQGSVGIPVYIFAAVALVRAVVLTRLSASAFLLPSRGDMHFYNDWALRILQGQWTDHHAFYGLPLYPYLLALIYKGFGYSPFVPGLLQAVADGGTAVLLYQLAVRLFGSSDRVDAGVQRSSGPAEFLQRNPGPIIGCLAAASWACYLPEQAYSAILMPTALAVFVFWFVIWQVVNRDQPCHARRLLGLRALIGFSAMGVATILFALPLVVAAIWFKWINRVETARRWRRNLVASALLMTGVGLGISPCGLHNYLVARDPVLLSAHSGVNFWIGNNPHANGYPKFPPGLRAGQEAMLGDSIRGAEVAAGRPLKRAEVSQFWSRQAKAYIRGHPGEWLKLIARKIGNFWNAFQYDDLSIITNLRENGILLPGFMFGLAAALGLPGMVLGARESRASRWVIAAIFLHLASLLPVFVTERYRLAAVPGLLLFAAFGLFQFWRSIIGGCDKRTVAYLIILALATGFVSIPRRDLSLWALDPYNSGWQALESKNLPLARRQLDLAYAYVPTNAEINFARGNLSLEEGDKTAAKAAYAATVSLDGTHEGAWNNLGVLALEENQWQLAAGFLRRALERDPVSAKTRFLLARALLNDGDVSGAEAEVTEALRLRPGQPEFLALKEEVERAPTPPPP